MMSRNQPRQTKEERQRIQIMLKLGCVLTWAKFGEKKFAECHHIIMPGKRLGHWYTIPLSPWYHRGVCELGKTKDEMRAQWGASLADGKRAFVASHHYTELELWQKLQIVLGLDDSLPPTKILPRRLGHVARPVLDGVHPLAVEVAGVARTAGDSPEGPAPEAQALSLERPSVGRALHDSRGEAPVAAGVREGEPVGARGEGR